MVLTIDCGPDDGGDQLAPEGDDLKGVDGAQRDRTEPFALD